MSDLLTDYISSNHLTKHKMQVSEKKLHKEEYFINRNYCIHSEGFKILAMDTVNNQIIRKILGNTN